jgi:hypothetical protein
MLNVIASLAGRKGKFDFFYSMPHALCALFDLLEEEG